MIDMDEVVYYSSLEWPPAGHVMLAMRGGVLVALHLGVKDAARFVEQLRERFGPEVQPGDDETREVREAREQVEAYFAGTRKTFDLPVDLDGYTPFQQAVFRAAMAIPYGSVSTYGELARSAGYPNAARAVGQVMRRNPVALVIPCHRVVGANSIGGYGGPEGVEIKRALLALEQT
jgi:methylated-DNA-[protein]-cysteine S-methyltransferase